VRGVSVTIPFKTEVIPLLDKVEGLARKIGAVNTIINRGGELTGYNTDCDGALKALEEKIDPRGKKIILLGAGGAARAIGFGLMEGDCQLTVVNRSKKKGERLSKELGCGHLPLSSLGKMKAGELEADAVINATPVGTYPRDGETPIPKRLLEKKMLVMDIVYQPLQTRLLREAKLRGCVTVDGLEMLVRQAAGQFEIWTGRRLEIGQIKKALLRTLKEKPTKIGLGGLKKGKG
jgi:shikimate dehydrogenase